MTNLEVYKTKEAIHKAKVEFCHSIGDCMDCKYCEEPSCTLAFALDKYDDTIERKEIIEVLREVVDTAPQLRVTQILSNLMNDDYYLSDNQFLKKSKDYLAYLLTKADTKNG